MRLIRTANAEELDAMRVAYVDVMGEMFDGGALPEEDFWNLVRLGDNVFARRRSRTTIWLRAMSSRRGRSSCAPPRGATVSPLGGSLQAVNS